MYSKDDWGTTFFKKLGPENALKVHIGLTGERYTCIEIVSLHHSNDPTNVEITEAEFLIEYQKAELILKGAAI